MTPRGVVVNHEVFVDFLAVWASLRAPYKPLDLRVADTKFFVIVAVAGVVLLGPIIKGIPVPALTVLPKASFSSMRGVSRRVPWSIICVTHYIATQRVEAVNDMMMSATLRKTFSIFHKRYVDGALLLLLASRERAGNLGH